MRCPPNLALRQVPHTSTPPLVLVPAAARDGGAARVTTTRVKGHWRARAVAMPSTAAKAAPPHLAHVRLEAHKTICNRDERHDHREDYDRTRLHEVKGQRQERGTERGSGAEVPVLSPRQLARVGFRGPLARLTLHDGNVRLQQRLWHGLHHHLQTFELLLLFVAVGNERARPRVRFVDSQPVPATQQRVSSDRPYGAVHRPAAVAALAGSGTSRQQRQ